MSYGSPQADNGFLEYSTYYVYQYNVNGAAAKLRISVVPDAEYPIDVSEMDNFFQQLLDDLNSTNNYGVLNGQKAYKMTQEVT